MGRYRSVAVELIAFLSYFATTLLEIITQKHICINLSKDHANTSRLQCYKSSENDDCCNSSDIGIKVRSSADTQYWLLYINLASLLMAMPSTLLLGIWSETEGRKNVLTLALLGTVLRVALFIVVVHFEEPFYFFIIVSLVTSTLGFNTSFMALCMAFIADITSNRQRTLRIVFLDCASGIGTGLAYFISGFYLECDWFQYFLWLVLAVSIFNMMYVICCLEKTSLSYDPTPICSCNYFLTMFKVFTFDPGNDRRWRLLTFVATFVIGGLVITGTNNLFVLYAQTSLCFSVVLTGYLAGALALRFIPSLAGVKLLQAILMMPNNWLIEAGLLSFFAGLILAAFSSTTRLLFIVPAFQFLGAMPLAVMKGSMSKLVEPQEQGTLFAVVSCLESLASFLGVFIFRLLYLATSEVSPGLSFVIGALLLIIPAVFVGIIHRKEHTTSGNIFYEGESSESDFGRQCSISTRSRSSPRACSVPVLTKEDLSTYQEYTIVTSEDQGLLYNWRPSPIKEIE